jgi:hypothetical protein
MRRISLGHLVALYLYLGVIFGVMLLILLPLWI